jgi:Bax protein
MTASLLNTKHYWDYAMLVSLLGRSLLVAILVIAVIAPFTFLVPKPLLPNTELPKIEVPIKPLAPDAYQKALTKTPDKKSEKALHNIKIPDFAAIKDIPTKKRKFFAFLLPAITANNNKLITQRKQLALWHQQVSVGTGITEEQDLLLKSWAKQYRINNNGSTLHVIEALLQRVDIIPSELVLVQAANESAWGTSRFARIGLNFFGIWCYQKGCGMVPKNRNVGANHEVAAFASIEASVAGYFNTINKHNAYQLLRTLRAELRAKHQSLDPQVLASGLIHYSERGTEYVLDITDMLRQNQAYFIAPNSDGLVLID